MTLPVSGAISFNAINVELGVAGTTQASLGQASYRTLAGVPSGAISMSNFYGKANQFSFSIASTTTNVNLRSAAISAGWNQTSKVVCTINAGVVVYSTSTGSAALTVNGSFPGGVELINNGTILGAGGAGGSGAWATGSSVPQAVGSVAGSSGGLGLSVSSAISINNASGRIAGGGGGGGGGGAAYFGTTQCVTQGEFTQCVTYVGPTCIGGAGAGGIGNGAGATTPTGQWGGSVQTGNPGTLTAGGAGLSVATNSRSASGAGGTYGSSGGSGGAYSTTGSGDTTYFTTGPAGGGAAGAAITGNASITWIAFGTRNGAIT